MFYLKNLISAIIPVLKYMVLSYFVIFISYIFYILMGYTDVKNFIINYATYILMGFNVMYIIYLLKRNRILCRKTKSIMPFILLGIGFSSFCNMLIFKVNTNEVVEFNLLFLILSSVIVGPFIEEIIFRYLLVKNLEKFNNKVFTILIASFVFGIIHTGIFNIIYAFLLGVILNIIYLKNKNLLYPLLTHSSANLITLFLTGYNVYILLLSFILLVVSMLIVKRDYLLK